jgi:hypothetical protein
MTAKDLDCVREVSSLLGEIRGAWVAIGPQASPAKPQGEAGS